MTTMATGSRSADKQHTATNASTESTAQATETKPKAVRKPRAKPEGLAIQFYVTDPNEISKLTALATADRRTPENYVALLTYKHIINVNDVNGKA